MSNDNPYSESCFKTVKYQPDYPGRFQNIGHARRWLSEFFDWYANHHRHSGLALLTPADVFFGRVPQLAATRQVALDAAYAAHPESFVHGRPSICGKKWCSWWRRSMSKVAPYVPALPHLHEQR